MNHITVSENNHLVKVMFQDIFYIRTDETNPRILKIFTGEHIYQKYGCLKDIEREACLTFTRCHKKFLVNLSKVVSIDKKNRMLVFSKNNLKGIECSRRNLKKVEQIWKSI